MTLAYIIYSSAETTAAVAGGGCVYYFVKGSWRNAAEGGADDFAAGANAVSDNKHRICRCAAWSGVMTAFDLGMQHLRHVHDPLNMMVAWGAANALFSVHRGPRAAIRQGLKGAAVGVAVSMILNACLYLACCLKEESSAQRPC